MANIMGTNFAAQSVASSHLVEQHQQSSTMQPEGGYRIISNQSSHQMAFHQTYRPSSAANSCDQSAINYSSQQPFSYQDQTTSYQHLQQPEQQPDAVMTTSLQTSCCNNEAPTNNSSCSNMVNIEPLQVSESYYDYNNTSTNSNIVAANERPNPSTSAHSIQGEPNYTSYSVYNPYQGTPDYCGGQPANAPASHRQRESCPPCWPHVSPLYIAHTIHHHDHTIYAPTDHKMGDPRFRRPRNFLPAAVRAQASSSSSSSCSQSIVDSGPPKEDKRMYSAHISKLTVDSMIAKSGFNANPTLATNQMVQHQAATHQEISPQTTLAGKVQKPTGDGNNCSTNTKDDANNNSNTDSTTNNINAGASTSTKSMGKSKLVARRKNATRETTGPLKVWLDAHLANPYPTKSEKMRLSELTRMSQIQVSTWFANARRRTKNERKGNEFGWMVVKQNGSKFSQFGERGQGRLRNSRVRDYVDLNRQRHNFGQHQSGSAAGGGQAHLAATEIPQQQQQQQPQSKPKQHTNCQSPSLASSLSSTSSTSSLSSASITSSLCDQQRNQVSPAAAAAASTEAGLTAAAVGQSINEVSDNQKSNCNSKTDIDNNDDRRPSDSKQAPATCSSADSASYSMASPELGQPRGVKGEPQQRDRAGPSKAKLEAEPEGLFGSGHQGNKGPTGSIEHYWLMRLELSTLDLKPAPTISRPAKQQQQQQQQQQLQHQQQQQQNHRRDRQHQL